MAKAGRPSQVGRADRGDTKRRLVDAAIETLRTDGFAGASARAIALRAECNQGLVFYHFGTVANLLLAALDETSRVRMERYGAAVAAISDPVQLVAVAIDIFREDLAAGHISVLAEMIAGASSTPGLGVEVAARIEPWIDFTEAAIRDLLAALPLAGLVRSTDAAYAIVAFYLGAEMLSHIGDDHSRADALLDTAGRAAHLFSALAPLAGAVVPASPDPTPAPSPLAPLAGAVVPASPDPTPAPSPAWSPGPSADRRSRKAQKG